MRRVLVAALTCLPLAAQVPQVSWSGETMRLQGASVSGSGTQFQVTLTMADDNGNGSLPISFRRWWHAEIGNLPPNGATLVISVTNAGYTDIILPVWATSADGVTFGAYQRVAPTATPVLVGGTTHRFTLATPPGVAAIRLAKYFPYAVARKNAFVAGLAGEPRVRSIQTLGLSVQGRPIERIELTDSSVADAGKQRIWIHTGHHPAETTSYFTMEGLVQWLLSGDPFAELLLDRAIVDIVPMCNPDGVALGNYRTNANSVNLENEWASPYNSNQPEIVALRAAIEAAMGTPAAPGSNPIAMLLNLHSSHNVSYPFHFQHSANPNWHPVTSNSGVLPVVHALEGQWIAAVAARCPFAALGTTQSSTAGAPSRPFVESMCHDRWTAQAGWLANPALRPVMAITFEGTYGRGPDQLTWNTEADYRTCGAQLGCAMVDFFGWQLQAEVTSIGSPCHALTLAGTLAPQGNDHLLHCQLSGGPPSGPGWLAIGLTPANAPLPAPFQACWQRVALDLVVPLPVPFDAQGRASATFTVPPIPGLTAWLQGASLTPQLPSALGFDASGALRVANLF